MYKGSFFVPNRNICPYDGQSGNLPSSKVTYDTLLRRPHASHHLGTKVSQTNSKDLLEAIDIIELESAQVAFITQFNAPVFEILLGADARNPKSTAKAGQTAGLASSVSGWLKGVR